MKTYDEKSIKSSEIIQLIILHSLYSLKESRYLYLQGGTAIRWCYSGTRFSEDLDFVTHLQMKNIETLIRKISEKVRRAIVAHLGMRDFEIRPRKTSRANSYISLFHFRPFKERKKISVKIEFEKLKEGVAPETETKILSMLPFVRHLISLGEFRLPNPNSLILVETGEEILSDKVRALLERDYLKGRDFYDLWFLNSLQVECKPALVKNKLLMYEEPFHPKREASFFTNPDSKQREEIIEAIRQDLSRFLPSQEMDILENNRFREIFKALKAVFQPFTEVELAILKAIIKGH